MTTPSLSVPPPSSGASSTGRTRRLSPSLIAASAMLVAVLTGGVALCALGVAFDARRQVAGLESEIEGASIPVEAGAEIPSSGEPSPPVAAPPTATVTPASNAPEPAETDGPTDVLTPRAAYNSVYSAEVLSPQAVRTDTVIDLDEPRVGAEQNRADLFIRTSFRTDVPVLVLAVNDQRVAEAVNPALTPADCADLIRTSPLPIGAEIPAQRGTVLCITTSPTQARAQGINQRMIVLRVTALGDGGRVSLEVSAWEVPR